MTYLWDGMRIMAHHYQRAWLGGGLRLDLDEAQQPGRARDVVLMACAVALGLALGGRWRLAAASVLLCPCWSRALLNRPDRVIEWRGYTGMLAGALLVSASLWLAIPIGIWWACRTVDRSQALRSNFHFRQQAARESPAKMQALGQYAVALIDLGDTKTSAQYLETVRREGTEREAEIAQQHLHALIVPWRSSGVRL